MGVFCNMTSTNINLPTIYDSNRLSHAYIVAGELADTLAIATVCSGIGGIKPCMNCTHCNKASRHIHSDITVVDKLSDKREIIVEQIRELKKDVIVLPNEAGKKAYIINDADLMNISAQNALLQILEEPPRHVVFILRTTNPAALLPTVRSRCIELKARNESDTPDSVAAELANEFFKAIEHGNAQLIAFMFRMDKLDKNVFSAFLTTAREQAAMKLRTAALGNATIPSEILVRAEQILLKAGKVLDLNVNVGHIAGMICASLLTIENE